ncbi:Panacea domain-containing protein [Helicobacter turcicus]|uniref:DUF4065 domain-containing protein n=1 Tax=Helicobacter turcicus TaxID=2867412 RepID=A0ABS7JPC6_9HELI|nr:type II toxin-antitoxin system antitoxin SocA domain-containing protein [Helicobacter turcicus]MBX7491268.1 DUF4065 domain-containing protein [Helicobacter turcicus]MBX7546093.1 DUF4065 domain-containing protein [Helicobacter turcicus]
MKARDIANAFLNKVPIGAVENGEGLHKVKLQKLLFFAQEEYLFRYEKPLFSDKIEAWQHGPVVREVWNEYAKHSNHIITIVPKIESLPKEAQKVVDFIWSKYGEKDTWYLRDLTHSYKIWSDKRDSKYNGRGEITTDEILQYKKECEKNKIVAREYIENLAKEFI